MSTTDEPMASDHGPEAEVPEATPADAEEPPESAQSEETAAPVLAREPAEPPAAEEPSTVAEQLPDPAAQAEENDALPAVFVDPDATPPTGIPVPIPAPRRSRRKLWLSLLALVLTVALVAVGFTVVRYLIDRGTYNDAHTAYEHADCQSAIPQFDDVITAWRLINLGDTVSHAESEKAECLSFQKATGPQDPQDPAGIAALVTFTSGRPKSPLTEAARTRVADKFTQPDLSGLAYRKTCEALPDLRKLTMIPPASIPRFLAACGIYYLHAAATADAIRAYVELFKNFGKDKVATETEAAVLKDTSWCTTTDLAKVRSEPVLTSLPDLFPGLLVTCVPRLTLSDDQAVDLAKEFLQKFRGHHFTNDLMTAIAKRLNTKVHAEPDSTQLGQAAVEGTVGGDKAVIIVHNDAPYPLLIAFTGAEPAFEEIDTCPSCTVDPDDKPRACNNNAPTKSIVITPGEYDITVTRPESAFSNGGYTHWSLAAGKRYFFCVGMVKRN